MKAMSMSQERWTLRVIMQEKQEAKLMFWAIWLDFTEPAL